VDKKREKKKKNSEDFFSPSFGRLSLTGVRKKIVDFMEGDPGSRYRVVIGADSCEKRKGVDYVVAIVVHRIGYGGIYFWQRKIVMKRVHLKERIYNEAAMALVLADRFLPTFHGNGVSEYDIEVHVDIGNIGETREMINEVMGMIRGSGYNCKIKPEAYGAAKIADRHT